MRKRWTLPRRQKERNRIEIRRWMLAQTPTLTVNGIAAELNVNQPNVSNTLADRRNNRQVLQYLVDKGCPVKYLALPPDMEAALGKAA